MYITLYLERAVALSAAKGAGERGNSVDVSRRSLFCAINSLHCAF